MKADEGHENEQKRVGAFPVPKSACTKRGVANRTEPPLRVVLVVLNMARLPKWVRQDTFRLEDGREMRLALDAIFPRAGARWTYGLSFLSSAPSGLSSHRRQCAVRP